MFKATRFFLISTILMVAMTGAAAYAGCIPISSVPYTIVQSGAYCLITDVTGDFSSNHIPAISINASHVDLDFRGHSITQIPVAAGPYASLGVQFYTTDPVSTDVTVHNGTLNGFHRGISLTYSTNNIEASNLIVDTMTIQNSKLEGIQVYGTDVRVTNNRVSNTRGAIVATGIEIKSAFPSLKASNRAVIQGNYVSSTSVTPAVSWGSAVGIEVGYFADLLVRDNTVINTWVREPSANSTTVGIAIDQMAGTCSLPCASDPIGGLIVQDNTVANSVAVTNFANPNTVGIRIAVPGDHAIVSGSKITLMNTGIDAASGDNAWPNTPPILLLNNSITSAITPIKGGVTLPQ